MKDCELGEGVEVTFRITLSLIPRLKLCQLVLSVFCPILVCDVKKR